MTVLNILITIVLGIIFNELYQSILFSIGYIPIRSFSGGYHAKTPQKCTLFSTIMMVIVLLLMKLVLPTSLILLMWMISSVVIVVLSPVQDENKPLDDVEVKVYKRRTRLLLCFESIIILVSVLLRVTIVSYCLTLALCCMSVMLILGIIKKGVV
jgi:accessory gene regulator B